MSTRRSRGGSLQAEEPPGQMHEDRRVSVQGRARRQLGLKEKELCSDPMSGQILWASRMLEGIDFISVSCRVIG